MARSGTNEAKRSWPAELIDRATALTRKFAIYLAAIGGTVTALFTLWDQLGLWQSYGVLGVAAFVGIIIMPLGIILATEVIPKWRAHRRQQRLVTEGVTGIPVRPSYFRLQPYDERDHEHFVRADDAHEVVREWLTRSEAALLYLTGRSGTGKTSLLNAWVLPELRGGRPPFRTLSVRSFADPVAALNVALSQSGVIWDGQPPEEGNLRSLLEKVCSHLHPERLLVVFDQFEEFVILHDPQDQAPVHDLLTSLTERPVSGLTLLAVVRSDYIGPLQQLGLPNLRGGNNWIEIGPFTRAAARGFSENPALP